MTKVADRGKEAEKDSQDALQKRSDKDLSFAFHRLPDAKAARGALQAQPSDFLVTHKGKTTFLEVKETQQLTRLPKSKISQYGSLLKFNLAGASVKVLVHRSKANDWVILDEQALFGYDAVPVSFRLDNLKSFPSANDALMEMFA